MFPCIKKEMWSFIILVNGKEGLAQVRLNIGNTTDTDFKSDHDGYSVQDGDIMAVWLFSFRCN